MRAHTVSYDAQDELIHIEYHGSVDLEDVEEVRAEAIALTKKFAVTRSLTDFSDASFDLSTLDIFGLPESTSEAYEESQMSVYDIKRAIVMNEDSETLAFLETVSVTRGQIVRLFFDIEEARDWLLNDDES